jgi:hypothetical protein
MDRTKLVSLFSTCTYKQELSSPPFSWCNLSHIASCSQLLRLKYLDATKSQSLAVDKMQALAKFADEVTDREENIVKTLLQGR